MSTLTVHASPVQLALEAAGFVPGAPAHVTNHTLAVDKLVCRRMGCPRCKRRGLRHQAYRRGRVYAAVAFCPACPFAEEV